MSWTMLQTCATAYTFKMYVYKMWKFTGH